MSQRSTLGPVLFHILVHDIFHVVSRSDLYTNDNILSYSSSHIQHVVNREVLWSRVSLIIMWKPILILGPVRQHSNTVYPPVIWIPICMRTNYASLFVDIVLYCYESQFMTRINGDHWKQHLTDKFNNTFRYLDDILALNNDDFNIYAKDIYPAELYLNKANNYNEECWFLHFLSTHIKTLL